MSRLDEKARQDGTPSAAPYGHGNIKDEPEEKCSSLTCRWYMRFAEALPTIKSPAILIGNRFVFSKA
ncbi:MAG: hypothetical protein CMO52_01945 [Verrucomicrobiales bacterium]|nr:hypothetical protein [Verrucomicrobiales bacterium]